METFGKNLRSVREARGIALADVAAAGGVDPRHLEALERDDFEALPDEALAKGCLRACAGCLDVDADLMIEAYVQERERRKPAPQAGEHGGHVEAPPTPPDHSQVEHRPRSPITPLTLVVFLLLSTVGVCRLVTQNGTESKQKRSVPEAVVPATSSEELAVQLSEDVASTARARSERTSRSSDTTDRRVGNP